ncbi:MAG: type II toxin-antitoxin system HicA family toxin [Patescibacteria group bacterium]|nr:type II toxin-antitoxin system HicA family toxin [Patescibacteria group bacterium]
MPSKIKPIPRKRFELFLKMIGCKYKRTKGDHIMFNRKGLLRSVVITIDKEVPAFIIRTNLRTLGLSTDEYIELIKQI